MLFLLLRAFFLLAAFLSLLRGFLLGGFLLGGFFLGLLLGRFLFGGLLLCRWFLLRCWRLAWSRDCCGPAGHSTRACASASDFGADRFFFLFFVIFFHPGTAVVATDV